MAIVWRSLSGGESMRIAWRSGAQYLGMGLAVTALALAGCSDSESTPTDTQPPSPDTTVLEVPEPQPVECSPESLPVVDENLVPECGVLFGTLDPPDTVVAATETPIGLEHQRTLIQQSGSSSADFEFGITRRYERGPDDAAQGLKKLLRQASGATGRRIYFSWKVDVGEGAWAAVAAGSYDDVLKSVAVTIDRSDQTVFLTIHHEPENDAEGTPEEYVAMWRHVHEVIETELANRPGGGSVAWVMNYKGHIDGGGLDEVDAYYPGNSYVDWIAFNPYNWKYCGGESWQSFAEVARPMVEYLTSNGRYLTAGEAKPLMVGETGAHEGRSDAESKAQWFADMSATLQSEEFAAIKAVVYFNQVDPTFCDWYWDSSPEAAAAFTALVTDPFFHPASVGTESP